MIHDSKAWPWVLTIAGSDSSGGAGIQADLKTLAARGVYGAAAITAITAQNTRGISAVQAVSGAMVHNQARAVLEDLPVGAVKVGMLPDRESMTAVLEILSQYPALPVVYDPVMVASSGQRLMEGAALASLRALLSRVTLLTPNLSEAQALLGWSAPIETRAAMVKAARQLVDLGVRAVLLKGGHLPGSCCADFLLEGVDEHWFEAPRVCTPNTHGTGCTLASAIAAGLAKGEGLVDAVTQAKAYLSGALAASAGCRFGEGAGPMSHLYEHPAWRTD